MVVGAVIIAIAIALAVFAGPRARRPARDIDVDAASAQRRPGARGVSGGIPIARILGIEIRLHLSWIFIIAIITVTVGGRLELAPADGRPDARVGDRRRLPRSCFLVTVVAHELAHALVAAASA